MTQQFLLPSQITKKDLIEKYEELLAAYQGKADELARARRQKTQAQLVEEKAVVQRVTGVSTDSVTQEIAELKQQLGRSLNQLAEKLAERAAQLADLERAITLQEARLAELHDGELAADSLEKLMQAYHERKTLAEQEFAGLMRGHQAALDNEKTTAARERERLKAEFAEQRDALKKEREREATEFQYARDRQRKLDQDAYEEAQRAQAHQLKAAKEAAERELSQREQAVSEREGTVGALQQQVDQFATRLAQEVAQARTEAAEGVRQELTRQIELIKAEHKWEKKLAEQNAAHLAQSIATLEGKLSSLTGELATAQKQVQELANKAIEGASLSKAFDSVNKIALEQATGRTDKKGAS